MSLKNIISFKIKNRLTLLRQKNVVCSGSISSVVIVIICLTQFDIYSFLEFFYFLEDDEEIQEMQKSFYSGRISK